MTVNEMIQLLRQYIADEQAVGWPDESELIAFLDQATDMLSEKLITDRDLSLLKGVIATESPQPLPDGFVRFVGNVPVGVLGNEYMSYGSDGEFEAFCWCKYPLPSSFARDEVTTYGRRTALLIVDLARILAQNKNEFDVSQDLSIMSGINQAITEARRDRFTDAKAQRQTQ